MVKVANIGAWSLYEGEKNPFIWINIILGWIVINIFIMFLLRTNPLILLSLAKNVLLIIHLGTMTEAGDFLLKSHTLYFTAIMFAVSVVGLFFI